MSKVFLMIMLVGTLCGCASQKAVEALAGNVKAQTEHLAKELKRVNDSLNDRIKVKAKSAIVLEAEAQQLESIVAHELAVQKIVDPKPKVGEPVYYYFKIRESALDPELVPTPSVDLNAKSQELLVAIEANSQLPTKSLKEVASSLEKIAKGEKTSGQFALFAEAIQAAVDDVKETNKAATPQDENTGSDNPNE